MTLPWTDGSRIAVAIAAGSTTIVGSVSLVGSGCVGAGPGVGCSSFIG
jgi:hypothetical protein